MALIDDLAAYYAGKRVEVETPEWRDAIGVDRIYAKPFTLVDQKRMREWLERDDPVGNAEIIVRKAENFEGELLFRPTDRVAMSRTVPAMTLNRIANELISPPTVEEAEGN